MSTEPKPQTVEDDTSLIPTPTEAAALTAARIQSLPTLTAQADALWGLPALERHDALGALPAPLVAALIEGAPERNTGLIASLPAEKFQQIANLGTPEQGRAWLERAVGSGSLAGAILPSLMTASSLADMLLTDPGMRRTLHNLLNFERAERWRQLLTTNEWHKNIDELLMADADELLKKATIKNQSLKAVLQSLLDFVPELYLETINLALERAKYAEDRPEEFEDLTRTPFGLPDMDATDTPSDGEAAISPGADTSPLTELLPEGGDPVFALATAGLTSVRKEQLEDQLKNLLRAEIVSTGSFAQAEMERAAGRVLFYLRVGLESFGPSVEDAARALETRHLNEISALGARAAEEYRQRSLSLSGLRDWLDGRQRQFLDALKQPEAGVHPQTREPVLWLAGRPRQPRAEWHPTPLAEVTARLGDAAAWGALARAAFGTPERMHTIFATAKTRTWDEALRRTVVALALYRRWEPELVRPAEDYAAFRRRYGTGTQNGVDAVRQIVLDALDSTPDAAWKPHDAKARARDLLLRAVRELETMPLSSASGNGNGGRRNGGRAHDHPGH
ncbi:MAG: hypothetical protein JO250_12740 [Armatimonadetes bacterium]|nr:hypothetical protein [Armatimonadota bacterium]